jgi:single-stranded DNA-specific DHH superfamily exonuclease
VEDKMKFLIGSKEEFNDFVKSIKKEDKVCIFAHDDLDGITSVIFLEKIFGNKGIENYSIEFIPLNKERIYHLNDFIKDSGFTKCFFLDLNLDQYLDVFIEIRNHFDIFLIDHHTINPELKDSKNILKSVKEDCVGYVLYLIAKDYFDVSSFNWLVCSTLISEYSFTSESHLDFIKKFYLDFTKDNLWRSEIGKLTHVLDFAIIHYKKDLMNVCKLIESKDLNSLKKASIEVEKEIERNKKLFQKEAEYSSKKDIYFWYFNSKFNITSQLSNILSCAKPDSTFIFVSDIKNNKKEMKVSARNQNSKRNMKQLLEKAMEGFSGAVFGGHVPASGGSFRKKDFEKFKKNILE